MKISPSKLKTILTIGENLNKVVRKLWWKLW